MSLFPWSTDPAWARALINLPPGQVEHLLMASFPGSSLPPLLPALVVFILCLTSCCFLCPQTTSQLGTSQLKIAANPFCNMLKEENKIKPRTNIYSVFRLRLHTALPESFLILATGPTGLSSGTRSFLTGPGSVALGRAGTRSHPSSCPSFPVIV